MPSLGTTCIFGVVLLLVSVQCERTPERSGTKLYVGGISEEIKSSHLQDLFGKYGVIVDVWVAHNPPGYAFVRFETERAATDAVDALNGEEFMGSKLRVEISRPRPQGGGRPRPGGANKPPARPSPSGGGTYEKPPPMTEEDSWSSG